MTYATLALAFILGAILGRLSKRRPVVRPGSSAYFNRRQEVWPVMRAWDSDAVVQIRAARKQ